MTHDNTEPEFSEIAKFCDKLESIVGALVTRAPVNTIGSMFSLGLDFNSKVTGPEEKFEASKSLHSISIDNCIWRAIDLNEERILATSESSNKAGGDMVCFVNSLRGKKVSSIFLHPVEVDLEITFDARVLLKLFAIAADVDGQPVDCYSIRFNRDWFAVMNNCKITSGY